MKKAGKYRYSLQFGTGSEEEMRAGELLERLGNRKSVVIVAALNDYILSHPDLENPNCKIEVKVDSGYSHEGIEEIVRKIVEKELRSRQLREEALPPVVPDERDESMIELLEADVAQMLDNLELFQ